MMVHWLLKLFVMVLAVLVESQIEHMMVVVDTQNMVVALAMVVAHILKG